MLQWQAWPVAWVPLELGVSKQARNAADHRSAQEADDCSCTMHACAPNSLWSNETPIRALKSRVRPRPFPNSVRQSVATHATSLPRAHRCAKSSAFRGVHARGLIDCQVLRPSP